MGQRHFQDTVFESIDTALLTIDSSGSVTSINESACLFLSCQRPQKRCRWHELLKDWPEITALLNHWLDQQSHNQTLREYILFERNGQSGTCLLTMRCLDNEQTHGWLLTIEDLSELVQMRQQVARMDRLASLGRMSAKIAHEVRNPLTGVSLMLDELHDRLLGQQHDQRLIRRALEEIERLETLVTQMLNFATLPKPGFQAADISLVFDDLLFPLQRQCQQQQIELVTDIAADMDSVTINVDRIKQVLLNIFSNALDAMPEGGRLSISAHADKSNLYMVISDNGRGIAKENLALIFEPFFTSKSRGTGLGLAISYNIISEHGGDISIDSAPGQGASATIRLPLNP